MNTPVDPLADPIVAGLNEPQRQAVLANDGPVLILAGAGSGKTRAITHKVAWLVDRGGYAPWEILAVTFTNRAAREMRERCESLIGADRAESLWLGTFHRIGVRLLRRHGELCGVPRNFVIYDQDDQKAMLTRAMADLDVPKDRVDVKSVQRMVNRCKQQNLTPDDVVEVEHRHPDDQYVALYRRYEERMRAANAVDFGDLLMLPLRLMTDVEVVRSEYQQRWRYVLVDEFQDTNKVQYDLLRAVLNPERRICVVGDDDQSIYRWRGAEVENILGFAGDFPGTTVIRLEQNYRSSAHILDAAGALISENTTRHPKTLWTEREAGAPVRLHRAATDTGEAEYLVRRILSLRDDHALREMAILYRTHAQSRVIEDALRRRNLPYQVVGGLKFYDRAEVKDLLAYLKITVNPADVVSFQRVINSPPRGIGAKTVHSIHDLASARGITFWEACQALADSGTTRVQNALGPFVQLIGELMAIAADQAALAVAQAAIERTRYVERLRVEGSVEAQARIENLQELLNAIDEFGETSEDRRIEAFLEQVALVADVDRADLESDRVIMMTAHTAKGLEFDVVFLSGLEQGVLPHFNSSDTDEGVEEERRLAYVAMTRARHHLHLSYADQRRRFGRLEASLPSPFLEALPRAALHFDDAGQRRGRFVDGFSAPAPRRGGRLSAQVAPEPTFAQAMPDYEDFSQEADPGIGPGVVVFHPTFGHGTVLNVSGHGETAKAQVRFESAGIKRLLARFLTPD